MHDPLFHGVALVVAAMRDQVLGADGHSPFQFTAERLDRQRADFLVRRSEVDQVIVVNRQGVQVVFLAGAIQETDGRDTWRGGLPLPWTRGENLEGVRSQFGGLERGPL